MAAELLQFAGFELDRAAYLLRRKGRVVRLQRIPMDVLLLLIERRGQLVTRGDIRDRIWGANVFVDADSSINTAIRKLRQVLRDRPGSPRFIETVPAKGYRFIAATNEHDASARPVSCPRATRPRIRESPDEATGAMTPFVGRDEELRLLLNRWQRALDGEGQAALIVGEPGIGKSRLLQQFHKQIAAASHWWIEAAAVPFFQSTPFYPVVELVRHFASPDRADGDGEHSVRIEPQLARAGLNPAEADSITGSAAESASTRRLSATPIFAGTAPAPAACRYRRVDIRHRARATVGNCNRGFTLGGRLNTRADSTHH